MLKTFFVTFIKIIFVTGLIYWLVSSGKLDFKLLEKLKDYPLAITGAFLLNLINLILISVRWRSILRGRSNAPIPLLGLTKISWIGQFFSSILPGSVSGDLVKILYIQKYDSNFSKKFVFGTILIDRVMGLFGLILLVGSSSVIFGAEVTAKSPAMLPVLRINYLLCFFVVLIFITFFFFHFMIRHFLVKVSHIAFSGVVNKVINLWDDMVIIKSKMIKAVGISIIVQIIGVIVFWSLIQPFVSEKLTFFEALSILPLGFVTLALPIAPSGLGVGHAIFQKLFEFVSIPDGASLFNLYFVVTLMSNLFGIIPYIMTKAKR